MRALAQAEYFWDVDPGEGNGTPFPARDGSLDETVEDLLASTVATSALAPGPHTFHARTRDALGTWSAPFTTVVVVEASGGGAPVRALAQAEYFWDVDPGEGNGTPFPARDGSLDETVEDLLASTVATSALAPGPHTFHARTRDALGTWSAPFTTVVVVEASGGGAPVRALAQAEYFWDVDPGEGNGTPFPARDGSLDETVEDLLASTVATSALAPGPHTFHARTRDALGTWSAPFTTVVVVEASGGGAPVRALAQAEYFWDVDPGEGNGTPFPARDGSLDETVEDLLASPIATSALAPGPHTFHARTRDALGTWSAPFTTVVVVEASGGGSPVRALAQAEYFWDVDPGVGNGTPFPARDGSFDETVEELLASTVATSALAPGPHTFHARTRDALGTWSAPFTTVVVVEASGGGSPVRALAQAEYFWDVDPGEGNGTPFPARDGSFDETVEELLASTVATSALAPGPHTFHARTRDALGTWSAPFTTVVVVEASGGGAPVRALAQAEYFWDVDPGEGNGTPFPARDGSLDETVEELLKAGIPPPASYGAHTFNVRVRDALGTWSAPFTTVVNHTVYGGTRPPDLTGDPDGDQLNNITEYFLGTRPLVPDLRTDFIVSGLEVHPALGPEPRFFLQIQRNHVAPDLMIEVQLSTDLRNWFNELSGALVTVIETPSQLKFVATQPMGPGGHQFFRFGLRQDPIP